MNQNPMMVKAAAAPKAEKKDATELVRLSGDNKGDPLIVLTDEMQTRQRPWQNLMKNVRDDAKTWRAGAGREFLSNLVLAAQANIGDDQLFRRLGGRDAMDLLDALVTGRRHPDLKLWEKLKINNPGASDAVLDVRRVAVAGIIALENIGLNERYACVVAARGVNAALTNYCTAEGIRKWKSGEKNKGTAALKEDALVLEMVPKLINFKERQIRHWIRNTIDALTLNRREVEPDSSGTLNVGD